MAVWVETDYFRTFHCKCGKCRNSCCRGWQIDVSEEEYFRLVGMNCSEVLHRKLECAFAPPEEISPETFRVLAPDWQGNCHLLSEDGLCMLQGELGEDVLPKICRFYPRSLRKEGNMQRACCSTSCEAVTETLLEAERLRLVHREDNLEALLVEEIPEEGNVLNHRCLRLLQDRSLPLLQRIHRVCTAVGSDALPTEAELNAAEERLLSLTPNLQPYLERETEPSADTERQKENLLTNHLIYMDFPFVDHRLAPEDAGFGLILTYDLMCRVDGHAGDALADAYAELFRLTEHTSFYYNAMVLLKKKEPDEE